LFVGLVANAIGQDFLISSGERKLFNSAFENEIIVLIIKMF
jgi:hypothetical protein